MLTRPLLPRAQLESKCFQQQERIEKLELEEEEKAELQQQQEKELLLKVEQVSWN
jgi:hypothetical protein